MKEKVFQFLKDKPKSKIALLLVAISFLSGEYLILCAIFIYWIINDLIKKETYFLETIELSKNPILYCIVLLLWMFFTYYSTTTIYYFY